MNKNTIVGIVVVIAVAVSFFFPDGFLAGFSDGVTSQTQSSSNLIVENVKIYDMDGSLAFQGNVDLSPELARIVAGERDSHQNDGSTFGNREGLLPQKARGYYKEYVVRTQGIRHAGPQRLVIGEDGEVYYTPDHYESFIRIE